MNKATHGGIREAIRDRIVSGEWQLGEAIPNEADFATEYGCSRTTVNRALQALADEGIVERKRRGGTRVKPLPAPQAQFSIPVIREQVESLGHDYLSQVLLRETRAAPADIQHRMGIGPATSCCHLETLHLADTLPFAFESRWVNLETVPEFAEADLAATSANEWLLRTVPFTRGEVALSATRADAALARTLETQGDAALFTMDRVTWFEGRSVTATSLFYAPGYRLELQI